MTTPTEWQPIDVEEKITATFDFSDEIGVADIEGVPVVTVALVEGTDANPAAILNGAPVVQGALVLQGFQGTVSAVKYKVRCRATLDDGRRLVRVAVLPVVTF